MPVINFYVFFLNDGAFRILAHILGRCILGTGNKRKRASYETHGQDKIIVRIIPRYVTTVRPHDDGHIAQKWSKF
jgi:hypothetical protein